MFPPPSLRRRGNISTSPPRNTIPTPFLKVDPTRPNLSAVPPRALSLALMWQWLGPFGATSYHIVGGVEGG